jgi:hypothetical protein
MNGGGGNAEKFYAETAADWPASDLIGRKQHGGVYEKASGFVDRPQGDADSVYRRRRRRNETNRIRHREACPIFGW